MSDPRKWIKDILNAPGGIRQYERERVLIDAAEAICDAMKRERVSRKDLAELLEVTQANVTQILSGNRNLTIGLLSDVFVALNRSLRIGHEPLAISAFDPLPNLFTYEPVVANGWSVSIPAATTTHVDKDGLAA